MPPLNHNCDCHDDDCLEAIFEIPEDSGISAIFQIDAWITKETADFFIEKYIVPLQEGLADEVERATAAEEELSAELKTMVKEVEGDSLIHVEREGQTVKVESKTYVYEQGEVSNVWIVNHNLNKYPVITLIDSSGRVFEAEKIYNDENTCTIYLNGATTGKVLLN